MPRSFHAIEPNHLLDICEVFFAKEEEGKEMAHRTATEVANRVNALWKERDTEMRISREDVYAAILEARRRDLFSIAPPSHESLQTDLCRRFGTHRDRIRVVASESRHLEYVCASAAELVADLIGQVAERRPQGRVHLGFGAGWTTRVVAYQLALKLKTRLPVPPLGLQAISSGFAANHAHTAPVTYFGFFEGVSQDLKEVGMFGPPYVRTEDYDATIDRVGVREAFHAKDRIDITLTSLASGRDPHSGLLKVAEDEKFLPELEAHRWVGDVQHLPYSATEPIVGLRYRAVTLFEIEDLVAMAKRRNRHVVLVAPPCPTCGRTRARALLPLLTEEKLRVWTHLVIDMPTARALLALTE